MTSLLRTLTMVGLLVAAPCSIAQSLWGGTKYGMSLEQVKIAVPGTRQPNNPSHLGDGAEERLRLENVEVVNQRFTASFYFMSGKLTQVTLSLEKGQTFHGALLVFNALTDALRAKYGRELSRQIERGLLNRANATWMAGRTNINVLALSVGEDDAILNINYQVRVARDSDKL